MLWMISLPSLAPTGRCWSGAAGARLAISMNAAAATALPRSKLGCRPDWGSCGAASKAALHPRFVQAARRFGAVALLGTWSIWLSDRPLSLPDSHIASVCSTIPPKEPASDSPAVRNHVVTGWTSSQCLASHWGNGWRSLIDRMISSNAVLLREPSL